MRQGVWRTGWILFGVGLLHFACGRDSQCSDGSRCVGEVAAGAANGGAPNAGAPGAPQGGEPAVTVGGQAGEPSPAVGGAGGAAGGPASDYPCDAACVTKSTAPWIVYLGNEEPSVYLLFAVKSDLVGAMKPVALGPPISRNQEIANIGPWSPDGKSLLVEAGEPALYGPKNPVTYLIHFGDGLPDPAIELQCPEAKWLPSSKKVYCFDNDHQLQIEDPDQGTLELTGANVLSWWFKSDDEIVFIPLEQKFTADVALLVRENGEWLTKTIALDITVGESARLSPDRSVLFYGDGGELWSVETKPDSTPQKLATGGQSALTFSPDGTRFLLATDTSQGTSVFDGPVGTLASPPLLRQVGLDAYSVLGYRFPDGVWAPDSSRAALFQDLSVGVKQLVLDEPGAADPWQPISVPQVIGGPQPLWSPDSKELAIVSSAGDDADRILSLVGADGSRHHLVTGTSKAEFHPEFSARGEFLAYSAKNNPDKLYYVDLRQGLQSSLKSIYLPGASFEQSPYFEYTTPLNWAPAGTSLILEISDATYLFDPASGQPPQAIDPVRHAGSALFQRAAR